MSSKDKKQLHFNNVLTTVMIVVAIILDVIGIAYLNITNTLDKLSLSFILIVLAIIIEVLNIEDKKIISNRKILLAVVIVLVNTLGIVVVYSNHIMSMNILW